MMFCQFSTFGFVSRFTLPSVSLPHPPPKCFPPIKICFPPLKMCLLYQNIFVVWTENKIYSKQDTSHLLPCLENQFHCQICTCKTVNCVFYKQIDLKPTKKSYERFLENDFMSPQVKWNSHQDCVAENFTGNCI